MMPVGDGMSVPADMVIAAQLQEYAIHPKQMAFVMWVSTGPSSGGGMFHLLMLWSCMHMGIQQLVQQMWQYLLTEQT